LSIYYLDPERVAQLSDALAVERATVKRLERVVQVLALENESFRGGGSRSNVRALQRRE